MSLESRPRVPLAAMPTPLEFMPRLTEQLGGPRIYFKRDDMTVLGGGGNKVRKLEYLVAEAQANGANVLVTVGGLQSNHARQTAAAAAKLGMDCELVLEDAVDAEDAEYHYSANLLLDNLFGARIHQVVNAPFAKPSPCGTGQGVDLKLSGPLNNAVETVLERIRQRGGKPYFMPVGGSTPLGALGYVRAVEEIAEQLKALSIRNPIFIVPTGSAGTHAGILAGLARLRRSDPVVGVAVSGKKNDKEVLVARLAKETLELLELPPLQPNLWASFGSGSFPRL